MAASAHSSASAGVLHSSATTAAELDAAIAAAAAAGAATTFVLFCGAVDAATGVSWCGDCVEADPVIAAALAKKAAEDGPGKVALVEVPLVRAEYKGVPTHWAR